MVIEQSRVEEDPYAILLDDTTAIISGLTFRGEPAEVVAMSGAPTLENLAFEQTGVAFDGSTTSARGSSIIVNRGSTATVRANVIDRGGPIGVFDGSSPTIEQNTLTGGPHIWGRNAGDGTVIRANTITDTVIRAIGFFEGTGAVTVDRNIISNPGEDGITVSTGSLTITGNTVMGASGHGIYAAAGVDVSVAGNQLEGNGTGVLIAAGSARGNTLKENTVGISAGGPTEVVNNGIMDGGTGVVAYEGSSTNSRTTRSPAPSGAW